jgi:hypothetical protein
VSSVDGDFVSARLHEVVGRRVIADRIRSIVSMMWDRSAGEAEAVLSGRSFRLRARPVDGHTAGLAAVQVLALEDADGNRARWLVRRAHPRDPVADDDDGCHPPHGWSHIASASAPRVAPVDEWHGAFAGERVLRASAGDPVDAGGSRLVMRPTDGAPMVALRRSPRADVARTILRSRVKRHGF